MQPLEVAPPPAAPLRIGLVAGGRRATNLGRWELGITYDPLFDHLGGGFPAEECLDPDEVGELVPGDLEKAIPDGQPPNTWFPYTLWIGDKCSTMGGFVRETYEARLTNELTAQSSRLLELIFSSGVVPISAAEEYTFAELGMPNRPLESTEATDLGGPFGVVEALSVLVEGMAAEIGGARGMIHVPHFLLTYLDFYGQVVRNPGDGTFITLKSHDHIVIAGAGYRGWAPDGTEPAAGTTYIYGTSFVEVRLEDEIDVVPGEMSQGVNIRTNEVEFRAERLALASWDLSAHVAVAVDMTDPGPATS